MDQFAAQCDAIPRNQLGVRQIHGQDGVILLHVRAQKEQRRTVQSQLELRQKTGVVEVEAVGIAFARDDIAAVIE